MLFKEFIVKLIAAKRASTQPELVLWTDNAGVNDAFERHIELALHGTILVPNLFCQKLAVMVISSHENLEDLQLVGLGSLLVINFLLILFLLHLSECFLKSIYYVLNLLLLGFSWVTIITILISYIKFAWYILRTNAIELSQERLCNILRYFFVCIIKLNPKVNKSKLVRERGQIPIFFSELKFTS